MNRNLTDVTIVLDRSGSMEACRQEAENGVNHFVEEQCKQPGDCTLTVIQFDTEYEFLCRATPIRDVPKFKLVPRGMTALLDAVGRAINECGERLSGMDERERPGLVVFVIVTDGCENSSHEFTKTQIKKMIERQQNGYAWQFTFLGANQDAFEEAQGLGIQAAGTANFDAACAGAAFAGAATHLNRMRTAAAQGSNIVNAFTDEERAQMSK